MALKGEEGEMGEEEGKEWGRSTQRTENVIVGSGGEEEEEEGVEEIEGNNQCVLISGDSSGSSGSGSGGKGGDAPPPTLSPIPPPLLEAIHRTIELGLGRGPLLGYPVIRAKVWIDGKGTRLGPETPLAAVRAATARALNAALKASGAQLLEPCMAVEVSLPEGPCVGEVCSDLSGNRRGHIVEVGTSGRAFVKARVPLRSMVGYSTALRSRTRGEGTFSMEFTDYEHVGPMQQEKLLSNPLLV
jgi:elongation factor G